MSAYEEILARGRAMRETERVEYVRQLARDERFAALASTVERLERAFGDSAMRQDLASNPGVLAHACGSAYGLRALADYFRSLIERPEIPTTPPPERM